MNEYQKKSVCYYCGYCIAKTPPTRANSCGLLCADCECDACESAGKNHII